MPYHMHRRTDCNTGLRDPGEGCRASCSPPRTIPQDRRGPRPIIGQELLPIVTADPTRWHFARVEYQVRAARITDIERIVALSGGAIAVSDQKGTLNAADLLRQLVYIPQASVFVAEVRREIVGGAVLALRPSVRAGGFVGTIDLLVVNPEHDVDRVTAALLDEMVRSAQNKGCTVVEAERSDDPAERTRWERHGFIETGPRLERQVAAIGTATIGRVR